MNHSIPIGLPWGHESIGYFSRMDADRLIIFVHGFGGSAAGTWKGIESALLADSRTSGADVVFFGYPSFRSQPEMSAGVLRSFLDDAAGSQRRWRELAASGRPSVGPSRYNEILIVAHSLGAPVARRAILDGLRSDSGWAPRARLLLFAPAHLGAYLLRLQQQMGGSFGSLVSTLLTLVQARVLTLDALKPGSPFLSQLLEDSAVALANGNSEAVQARRVIFGDKEDVVMTGTFLADPPPDVWVGHGHCSICKTKDTSQAVLDQL